MKNSEYPFEPFADALIFIVEFGIRTIMYLLAFTVGATARGGRGFVGAKYVDGFPVEKVLKRCYFCGADYREIEYCSIQVSYKKILEKLYPPPGVNLPVKILKTGVYVKHFGGDRFAVCAGCGGLMRLVFSGFFQNEPKHFVWREISSQELEKYIQSWKKVLNTKDSRFKHNDYSGVGSLVETWERWK